MEQKSEGILIQATAYLGSQRILKVFTPEQGLITLFAKGSFSSFVPFCRTEWVYGKGWSELMRLKEATLLDPLLTLRQSYLHLCAAGVMAKDVLLSQYPGKESSSLYRIFLRYLEKIAEFERPEILSTSFKLKILTKEGILHLKKHCSQCDNPASSLSQGESFCIAHSPLHRISFSYEEWQQLFQLLFSSSFSQMKSSVLSKELIELVNLLFKHSLAG